MRFFDFGTLAQDDIYYVTIEIDDVDRSLDDARDDSGAVNSPSTTLGMTIYMAQDDGTRMRSLRLRYASLRMTMRMRSSRLRYASLRMTVRMRCLHYGRHDDNKD